MHRDGLRVGKLVRIWSLKGTCVQHACGAGGGGGGKWGNAFSAPEVHLQPIILKYARVGQDC